MNASKILLFSGSLYLVGEARDIWTSSDTILRQSELGVARYFGDDRLERKYRRIIDGAQKLTIDSAAGSRPSKLAGTQLDLLATAVASAYTPDELRRVVRTYMNEELDALASGMSYNDQVFALVLWAERRGRMEEFVRCVQQGNPNNSQLNSACNVFLPPPSHPIKDSVQLLTRSASEIEQRSSTSDISQDATSAFVPSPTLFNTDPLDIEWVKIAAGPFLMGSDINKDPQARNNEMPQHLVYLQDYYIAKYPITNAQFGAFAKATGYNVPAHWPSGTIMAGRENHPVVHVSWYDATAYCEWASKVTQREIRLPNEAEWEKSARGTSGCIWPWGDQPPTAAICNTGLKTSTSTAVDNYPAGASIYGVMDMAGNTWEWTSTLWGSNAEQPQYNYPYNPDDGREAVITSAAQNTRRVLRGGSFYYLEDDVRCARRCGLAERDKRGHVGFRVVLHPA